MAQQLHDSGKRREFKSGAVRDRGDLKPRPDLISPHAQMREGMIMTLGGVKYDLRNWELGMPISEMLASAQRHIEQYKRGDTDEDHIAQARWNLGTIIHYEEEIAAGRMDPAIDDMPHYGWKTRPWPRTLPSRHPGPPVKEYTPQPNDRDKRLGSKIADGIACPHPTASEQLARPTFYICGPMTGLPFFNFPAFDGARDLGQSLGYTIISPADNDREHGIDPIEDPGCVERLQQSDPDFLKKIVTRDLAILLNLDPEKGDGLALLPGWEDSKGATAEIGVALWLGLNFVDATTFKPIDNPLEV